MRAAYKNPKELESKLRDLVNTYLDGLIGYEKLEKEVTAIINANENRVIKNGFIPTKLANALGEEGVNIINKIAGEIDQQDL